MAVFKKPKPLTKKEDPKVIQVPMGAKKWGPEQQARAEKSAAKKLPEDKYKKEFEPIVIETDEWQEIHVYIQRTDDELGLPRVHLRQYQTTDTYTGYTKKGFSIPLEYLHVLIHAMNVVLIQANEKGLTSEVEMRTSFGE